MMLDQINPRHYEALLRACKGRGYAFGRDPRFVMELRSRVNAVKYDKTFLRQAAKRLTPAMRNTLMKVSADASWWPWQEAGKRETVEALIERYLIETHPDDPWNDKRIRASALGRAVLAHLDRTSRQD